MGPKTRTSPRTSKLKETKKQSSSKSNRRKHVRFDPGFTTMAKIDSGSLDDKFEPNLFALVYNESYGGCAVLTLPNAELSTGDVCQVQVGQLEVVDAAVVWETPVGRHAVKYGLRYFV